MFRIFLLLALTGIVSAAESDALAISANIQAHHLPYGTVIDPVYASPISNEIVGYSRCGDSAIWTGHYLAAESFRYGVTKSPEALKAVKNALQGINMLLNVTGTDLLARCYIPADSPYLGAVTEEEKHNGMYTGTVNGTQYVWFGNTSRDQYTGVFFGLTVAHNVVSDPQVQGSVRALAVRMLNFLRSHAWTVAMPDGKVSTSFVGRGDQQLSFMKLGSRTDSHFTAPYKTESVILSVEAIAPIAIEVQDVYSSYFKFNLDYDNYYGLLSSGDNFWAHLNYRAAYDVLHKATKSHQNAHFNMIDRAINGADATRDQETRDLLDAWLKRPRRDNPVNLTSTVPTCDNATRACSPIPVQERVPTDFLWQRSPFQLVGDGQGVIETAGIDYILPYWMARYYGVVTK